MNVCQHENANILKTQNNISAKVSRNTVMFFVFHKKMDLEE
jgi:hypothetical protein